MKKSTARIISLLLAFSLIFSGASAVGASAAGDIGETLTKVGVKALDGIVVHLLSGINRIFPNNKSFIDPSQAKNENFYSGTKQFLDEPAEEAQWMLGYAQASLVPDDWQTNDYYLGGFITINNGMKNLVEEVADDMRVRVIAVSDNSGRGVSVFANIDSIGMCSGDIKTIRKYLEELDLGVEFNTITVTYTHCHSCIDTQGLWTDTLKKVLKNMGRSLLRIGNLEAGVNTEYIDFLCHTAADTMAKAVKGMTAGDMTYAVKDLNHDYFNNKNRKSSTAVIDEMSRFVFTPYDESAKPTMIVNIAAHPDIAGLATDGPEKGRTLSGDYVYYMGRTIENAGFNFMFFNGAIAGIYAGRGLTNDSQNLERRYHQSERYGVEMANIALNLTKTYDEINAAADWDTIEKEMAIAEENNGKYTLWFDGWEPTTERKLEPILNVLLDTVRIEITNPLIILVGKLGLVNYNVMYRDHTYYLDTEIGYMEMGDVKIALMPGEVVQDLVKGGASLTAEGSYSGKAFGYAPIVELFGEDTVVFGLANDAIGYVVPDNDYSLAIVDDHYQELISLGSKTASAIMKGYADIAKKVN